jgi:hypothetical protein
VPSRLEAIRKAASTLMPSISCFFANDPDPVIVDLDV